MIITTKTRRPARMIFAHALGRFTHDQRSGMTLLEMLAALTLASLLLVSTIAIFRAISRTDAEAAALTGTNDFWLSEVEHQLQRDLQSASEWRASSDGLELHGPCFVSTVTQQPTSEFAVVRWRVEAIGKRIWLVRYQSVADSLSNAPPTKALIAADIKSVKLFPSGKVDAAELAPDQQWRPVPLSMLLQMQFVPPNSKSSANHVRTRHLLTRAGALR